jgi:hypothetical protein
MSKLFADGPVEDNCKCNEENLVTQLSDDVEKPVKHGVS